MFNRRIQPAKALGSMTLWSPPQVGRSKAAHSSRLKWGVPTKSRFRCTIVFHSQELSETNSPPTWRCSAKVPASTRKRVLETYECQINKIRRCSFASRTNPSTVKPPMRAATLCNTIIVFPSYKNSFFGHGPPVRGQKFDLINIPPQRPSGFQLLVK